MVQQQYESVTEITNRHDFLATISKTYSASQSQTIFYAPDTGMRVRCTGGYVSTAATSGRIYIYFRDSGITIADLNPTTANTFFQFGPALLVSRENDAIMVTSTTGSSNLHIALNIDQGDENVNLSSTTSTSTTTTTSTTTSTSTSTTTTTTTTKSTSTSTTRTTT